MKKDKKWLKEEAMNLYPSHSEVYEHPDYTTVAKVDLINDFIELLDQLDEPEKPVIPKFVAEWIEVSKKHYSIGAVFHDAYDGKLAKVAIEEYIFENQDLFAQAWLGGYEVEKEKKYQVIIRDGEYIRLYLCKHGDNVIIGTNDNYIEKCPEVTYLTEQEIKDYDERFWAFAQEVTE